MYNDAQTFTVKSEQSFYQVYTISSSLNVNDREWTYNDTQASITELEQGLHHFYYSTGNYSDPHEAAMSSLMNDDGGEWRNHDAQTFTKESEWEYNDMPASTTALGLDSYHQDVGNYSEPARVISCPMNDNGQEWVNKDAET